VVFVDVQTLDNASRIDLVTLSRNRISFPVTMNAATRLMFAGSVRCVVVSDTVMWFQVAANLTEVSLVRLGVAERPVRSCDALDVRRFQLSGQPVNGNDAISIEFAVVRTVDTIVLPRSIVVLGCDAWLPESTFVLASRTATPAQAGASRLPFAPGA